MSRFLTGGSDIRTALGRVAEFLAGKGEAFAIVILGGAALNLLGVVERETIDVDILAVGLPEDRSVPRQIVEPPPRPLSQALVLAIHQVAEELGLAEAWMNIGPALQWRSGLPPGLAARIEWRTFGDALDVGIVSRYDLIFFKLFAAADDSGTDSVHYKDLLALNPTPPELRAAADWVRGQDASEAFAEILERVVTDVSRQLRLRP